MWKSLLQHQFDVSKIRGQGYDGASNMRGQLNGLQALVLQNCPYAYYVHYFAHRLQLALVYASREIIPVHQFFTQLVNIINALMEKVTFFCNKHQIELPDMDAPYVSTRFRPRRTDRHVTFEHYYRVDLFTTILDTQVQELNSRFNEKSMELLSLSSSLTSKEVNVDQICLLVEKYYPDDFTEQERDQLKYQLELFNIEMTKNTRLSGASTLAHLCQILVETNKSKTYRLLGRVIRLILTLPVSTATTVRAFSAMKLIKTRLPAMRKVLKTFLTFSE